MVWVSEENFSYSVLSEQLCLGGFCFFLSLTPLKKAVLFRGMSATHRLRYSSLSVSCFQRLCAAIDCIDLRTLSVFLYYVLHCLQNALDALEIFSSMRYINLHFSYLLESLNWCHRCVG